MLNTFVIYFLFKYSSIYISLYYNITLDRHTKRLEKYIVLIEHYKILLIKFSAELTPISFEKFISENDFQTPFTSSKEHTYGRYLFHSHIFNGTRRRFLDKAPFHAK